jgi:mRNA-decapping enzyme 1B
MTTIVPNSSSSTANTNHDDLRKQANLRLLQRVSNTRTKDGTVQQLTDIVATATHVVLYEYLIATTSNWTKCNIEGSLFLVEGTSSSDTFATFYQLIILNRTSANNYICNVVHTLQASDQSPYVIVRQENGPILGFWFHNADERMSFFAQLQSTILQIQSNRQQQLKPPPSLTPPKITTTAPIPQPFTHPPSVPPTASAHEHNIEATNDTSTSLAALSLKNVLGIGCSIGHDDSTTHTSSPLSPSNHISSSDSTTTNYDSTATVTAAMTLSSSNNSNAVVVLDKKSLQLTLLSLIQDDRFLDLLHSQYLKVVRTRAAKQQQQQKPPSSVS